MEHPYHADEGFAGYIMTQSAYALYSTTRWQDPADSGDYFIVSTTAITDTDQKPEEREWRARKELLDTYRNIRTVLQQLFKKSIDPTYRSGGMKTKEWQGKDSEKMNHPSSSNT